MIKTNVTCLDRHKLNHLEVKIQLQLISNRVSFIEVARVIEMSDKTAMERVDEVQYIRELVSMAC